TVASYLQGIMNGSGDFARKVHVYNFGRSGYFSTQETILFNRLLAERVRCDMVVFLDGLNDFHFSDGKPSGWGMLAAHMDDVWTRYQQSAAGYGVVTPWGMLADFCASLPLVRLLAALRDRHKP